MEWIVFVTLLTTIFGVLALARHMKKKKSSSDEPAIDITLRRHALIDGNLIEYKDYFLKADKQGFIQTKEGDLSIECFQQTDLEVIGLSLLDQLKQQESQFVQTNRGEIAKCHFVPKG